MVSTSIGKIGVSPYFELSLRSHKLKDAVIHVASSSSDFCFFKLLLLRVFKPLSSPLSFLKKNRNHDVFAMIQLLKW